MTAVMAAMGVMAAGVVGLGGSVGFSLSPATQTVSGSTQTLSAPFRITNETLSPRSFQFFLLDQERPAAPSPGSSPVLGPGESFDAVVQWSAPQHALTDVLQIGAFSPTFSGGDGTTTVTAEITFAFTPVTPCPGDANVDGVVNGADLSVLLAQFGQNSAPSTGGDLNGDGHVDAADLSVLLSNFGFVCEG